MAATCATQEILTPRLILAIPFKVLLCTRIYGGTYQSLVCECHSTEICLQASVHMYGSSSLIKSAPFKTGLDSLIFHKKLKHFNQRQMGNVASRFNLTDLPHNTSAECGFVLLHHSKIGKHVHERPPFLRTYNTQIITLGLVSVNVKRYENWLLAWFWETLSSTEGLCFRSRL
jgi:hypothetical protein